MNDNIFDDTNNPTSPEQNPKMVLVELNALGNVANDPRTIVLLLTPVDQRGIYDESKSEAFHIFFPVPVPQAYAPIYFHRITSNKSAYITNNVTNSFLRFIQIQISHVEVKEEHNGFSTSVTYKLHNGEERKLYTKLHIAIIHALLHKVPIYIDELLLIKISQTVKLNFAHTSGKQAVDVIPAAISFHIKRGDKPEDLDQNLTGELLKNLNREKLDELTQLAIEHEVYEWAQLFSDLHQNEEQKENNDKEEHL